MICKSLGPGIFFRSCKVSTKFIKIMPVNRAEITQFQCFEQVTAFAYKTFDTVFDLAGHFAAEMSAYRQFPNAFQISSLNLL